MRAKEEALRILEAALKLAQSAGIEAEVALGGGAIGLTRFADNQVHQSVELDRETFSVRVISNGRSGRAETTDCSATGIQVALKQARMIAELMPPAKEPAELPGPQTYRTVDAYDPETDRAGALDRMAIAGRTIVEAHKQGLLASGYVATRLGSIDLGADCAGAYAIANTRGLTAYHASTRATFSVTAAKKDGPTGWAESESHGIANLDTETLTEVAIRKAKREGSPRALKPGRHTVVLEPAAVAAMLEHIACSVGAEDVYSERSFISGRLGQKIAGDVVTIADDHAHPFHRGPPFDAEGVARRKVMLIERGVARSAVYSLQSARRYGAEPTGHYAADTLDDGERAHHLVMSGGESTLADLIGGTKSGVLISRFWYTQLVDKKSLMLTGVTRDGTFLIEGGEIVAPVENMRFNMSVLDLLTNIDGMSAPVWASGLVVPAVRARDFRLSSGITL